VAITGQYMSILGDILKIFYIGPVREQLNNSTVLMKRISRNKKDVSGKYANIPIHVKRNVSAAARQDTAALNAPGAQGYDTAKVSTKFNYAAIQVTGPTIKASRNDRGAFLRAVNSELKGAVTDLKKDINRQLHGDGTGYICKCNTAKTSTDLTIAAHYWDHPEWYLHDNMAINVIASDATTLKGETGNTSCMLVNGAASSTNLPFDQDTAVTATATTDYIGKNLSIHDGGKAASGYNVEMMGIRGIVDDGNILGDTTSTNTAMFIQNIDAGSSSAVTQWRSKVLENSSAGTARALTLDLMQEAMDYATVKNDGNITLILTTAGIRRRYLDLLRADRRYVKEMTLDGGFKALEYDGVPLVVDKDCTNNNIFFLDESTFSIYHMSDFDWMDDDGAVLHRTSGYDAYEAQLYYYAELGCTSRNKNVRLADVDETALA